MKKIALLMAGSIIILIVFLQNMVGFGKVLDVIGGINPVFVPVIVALPILVLLVYSFRWRLLLRSVDVNASIAIVFRYVLIGAVFNYMTPMLRFGGEPIKGYMLAKHVRTQKRKVFASIAMDSVITFLSLLALVYFAMISMSMFNIVDRFTLWVILTFMLLPLTLGCYVVYDKHLLVSISKKIEKISSKIHRGHVRGLAGDALKFRDSIKKALKRKDLLAKSLAIAALERLLEVIALYVIFISLGVNVSISTCAIALGVGILAGGIPFLPGGLVLYESSTIFILTLLGIPFAPAASAILMWRFVSYWLVILIGIIYSWFYGVSFSIRKKQRHFFKFGL